MSVAAGPALGSVVRSGPLSHSIPLRASSTLRAVSPGLKPPLEAQTRCPPFSPASTVSNLSSLAGKAQGQWCGKWTHAERCQLARGGNMAGFITYAHTQGVRAQVLIAAHPVPVRLVEGRVAGHVLRPLALLPASSTASREPIIRPRPRPHDSRSVITCTATSTSTQSQYSGQEPT